MQTKRKFMASGNFVYTVQCVYSSLNRIALLFTLLHMHTTCNSSREKVEGIKGSKKRSARKVRTIQNYIIFQWREEWPLMLRLCKLIRIFFEHVTLYISNISYFSVAAATFFPELLLSPFYTSGIFWFSHAAKVLTLAFRLPLIQMVLFGTSYYYRNCACLYWDSCCLSIIWPPLFSSICSVCFLLSPAVLCLPCSPLSGQRKIWYSIYHTLFNVNSPFTATLCDFRSFCAATFTRHALNQIKLPQCFDRKIFTSIHHTILVIVNLITIFLSSSSSTAW